MASSGEYPFQDTRNDLFACAYAVILIIQDGIDLKLLIIFDKQNLCRWWMTGVVMLGLKQGHMEYIVYSHGLR